VNGPPAEDAAHARGRSNVAATAGGREWAHITMLARR
jgi:hypothetical protein